MPWYLWRGIYNNKQGSGITKTINKDYLEKQLANSNIKFVDASIIVNKIKFNAKERLNFYNSVLMLLNSGIPLLNVFKILIKSILCNFFLHSKKIEFIILTGGLLGFKLIITLLFFIPHNLDIAD